MRNMPRTAAKAAFPKLHISAMSSMGVVQATDPATAQVDNSYPIFAGSESDTGTHTRMLLLPPTYSAEPLEGEQTVYCDRLPTYRQVVRQDSRGYFTWPRRSPPHAPADELAEMLVFWGHRGEAIETSGKLVVSGWKLALALLFALIVGIAISRPI